MRLISLVGQRVGRLTVIEQAVSRRYGAILKTFWRCRCDCGHEVDVVAQRLRRGETRSCGCFQREIRATLRRTHGAYGTPEYLSWRSAKGRCYNTKDGKYPLYGGRGIRMCDEWRNDFVAFLTYIGRRPSLTHSIDRIDNDGHYEPGNVRWATPKQQSINQSKTIRFRTIDDEPLCLRDVARTLSMYPQTLQRRLLRAGVLKGAA